MAFVELNIKMDEHGNVQVVGAIDNKIAAYAMLEMARDAIVAHHAAKVKSSPIIAVPNGTIPFVRKQ